MKLTKFIYTTGLLFILIAGSSCNKWLELRPQDGIIKQEFWRTKEDVRAALNGIYTSARDLPLTIFQWGELRGDMIVAAPRSTAEQRDIIEVNITPSNSITRWSTFYRTINFCNILLENAPGVKAIDPTLTDAQLATYMGEALTMRALMYFYLVRTFRDVPLKLRSTSKDSDIEEIGKTDGAKVLDQIIADLKVAGTQLPESYDTPEYTKGHITKLAVNALLADIYLWNEKYTEAIAECDKVINYAAANPGKLGLITVSSNWWANVYGSASSVESIFEFAYAPSVSTPFQPFLVAEATLQLLASLDLATTVFAPDLTPSATQDYRPDSWYNSGSSRITKYGGGNPPQYVNFKVYRYSDVLMIKAEALAARGSVADCQAALDIVYNLRTGRNAVVTTLPSSLPSPSDPSSILSFILAERAREFAFEGKRWFDLLRNAKRDNYAQLDLLIGVVSRMVPPTSQQTAINKLRDVNSHYLPIHETEIFADTKLVQNPFYVK